jgi:hypothetical protein
MAHSNSNSPHSPVPQPLQSVAEAEELIGKFGAVMTALTRILQEEKRLLRAGRISQIARIAPEKTELARRYVADAALIRSKATYLARELPREFSVLRQQHDDFHECLNINLAVLATAHAVSEGIIRGVADELASKAAPQTYGVTGRHTARRAGAAQPISLSRTI